MREKPWPWPRAGVCLPLAPYTCLLLKSGRMEPSKRILQAVKQQPGHEEAHERKIMAMAPCRCALRYSTPHISAKMAELNPSTTLSPLHQEGLLVDFCVNLSVCYVHVRETLQYTACSQLEQGIHLEQGIEAGLLEVVCIPEPATSSSSGLLYDCMKKACTSANSHCLRVCSHYTKVDSWQVPRPLQIIYLFCRFTIYLQRTS